MFWKNLSFSYLYLETRQNSDKILTKVDVPVIASVPVIVSVYFTCSKIEIQST